MLSAVVVAVVAVAAAGAAKPPERFIPVRTSVVVPAGGTATVAIRVRRPGGRFVRTPFRFATVPPGLRVTWRRSTPNGDLTVRIRADADLTPGRRRVVVAYAGGARANVVVVTPAPVAAPTFTVTAEPSVLEIPLGERRDVRVALQPVNGFSAPVGIAVSAPPGISAQLTATALTPGAPSTTLRLTGAAAGAGVVTVRADGGGVSRVQQVVARVVEPPLPDAVTALRLAAGESRTLPVTLQAGQVVAVRAKVISGDADLSAFDSAGVRLQVSAQNGTTPERVDLSGPGDFTIEVRAAVDSEVEITTGAP